MSTNDHAPPPSYGMAMAPAYGLPTAHSTKPSEGNYQQAPPVGFVPQANAYNMGYDQPQAYNQPPGYIQPQQGYPQQPGYAQQPGYGQPSGYGQPTGYGQSAYPQTAYAEPGTQPEMGVPKASDDFNITSGGGFSDKAIRRGFIRKVYIILFTQLLVTFGFICLFIFVEPVKKWVQNSMWFYICAYVLFLVLYFVLICCPSVRKNYPGNFICLGLFTLAFSYLTATISSYHDTGIVLMAAGITAAVCLAISLFAVQTKIDFTMCSGLLFVLVMVLFFFGWACLITYYAWGYNHIMNCVWGGLAALVFGLFLIYDTQQVMGGRKYQLSPEEYIYGALQLYIDIVYIFIIILGLMGSSK